MMHLGSGEDGPECYYYMVHHRHRVIFWLNKFDAGDHISDDDAFDGPSHISTLILLPAVLPTISVPLEHALEDHYWSVA